MYEVRIKLNDVLREKNVSRNRLCRECYLQRTQLKRYCDDKAERFDLGILARICTYLQCTPNDILQLVPSEDPEEEY